ncbi:tRNA(Ile2) 2-agmatinylcytidine synthetase, partial [Halobium palmae]
MTIIGLDDTDSRERGMCTTYLAARVAEAVVDRGGRIHDRLLVRL